MPEERRGLSSGAALEGGQDMGTGESLSAPQSVQRLQRALHAKAKGSPSFRFYSLCDKVWRADVLAVACQEVRRNGGAPGVDGQTVAGIEGVRCGPVAWGIGAGPEGGDLSAGCSSTGSHTQEAARTVSALGHSLHTGPGGADGGDAGAVANLRSRPGNCNWPPDCPPALESHAQHIAAQWLTRHADLSGAATPPQGQDVQHVDVDSLELIRTRSVGVEHVGLWAMDQLGLRSCLHELGMGPSLRAAAIGSIIARMARPGVDGYAKAPESGEHKIWGLTSWNRVFSQTGLVLAGSPLPAMKARCIRRLRQVTRRAGAQRRSREAA